MIKALPSAAPSKTREKNHYYFILSLAMMTLFFLQSTRQLLATIYYFVLTNLGFTPMVFYLLVFLAPLLMLFLRAINVNILMAVSGVVVVTHSLYCSMNPGTEIYIFFHALVIVAFCLYLPSFLTVYSSLQGKSKQYSVTTAGIMAPLLALVIDNAFKILGNSLSIAQSGVVTGAGDIVIHPVVVIAPVCVVAYALIHKSYTIVSRELKSVRAIHRSGVHISTVIPGLGFGLSWAVIINLLGYPGEIVRWTGGSHLITVLSTIVVIISVVIYMQYAPVKVFFFPRLQVVLNAIQLFVIGDILYFDTGAAQFLLGPALVSSVVDMFIFLQAVGSRNYSIQYFIRVASIGILTFLLVSFFIMFTFTWSYTGPVGVLFRGKLNCIVVAIGVVYVGLSFVSNYRIRSEIEARQSRRS